MLNQVMCFFNGVLTECAHGKVFVVSVHGIVSGQKQPLRAEKSNSYRGYTSPDLDVSTSG